MNDSPLKLTDLVCFSHIRWNFGYQRPQHILTRFAKCFRVFYIEEPVYNANSDRFDITLTTENIVVVVPHLQYESTRYDVVERQKELLIALFDDEKISNYLLWYYTPAAIPVTEHLTPRLVIYDCITEFATQRGRPDLKQFETELLRKADIVFAAGQSLYEVKRKVHAKVYCLANSVDTNHFEHARTIKFDPPDQDGIPHPRIGYYGMIDDRLDIDLLEKVSRLRPQWNFIMIGPVTKIDPSRLPNFHNIHYLGIKLYQELPHYLSGWDVAMIPFVHNELTRYNNPMKTAEYLAAARPVVSTPIIDVIRNYGNKGLVRIAGTPDEFVRVAQEELEGSNRVEWIERVDEYLSLNSWNKTWGEMMNVIGTTLVGRPIVDQVKNIKGEEYV
jgi:UDP-galactopyranose mutase